MGKSTICIGENKGADQLRSNCEADQSLCFRCTDSTILLLLKSEISSFYPASVIVQAGLSQTWSEPKLLVFSSTGSYFGCFQGTSKWYELQDLHVADILPQMITLSESYIQVYVTI